MDNFVTCYSECLWFDNLYILPLVIPIQVVERSMDNLHTLDFTYIFIIAKQKRKIRLDCLYFFHFTSSVVSTVLHILASKLQTTL